MTATAIRTDRALRLAHGGATPRLLWMTGCTKQRSLVASMGAFAVVPSAYVTDQESNPPREESG